MTITPHLFCLVLALVFLFLAFLKTPEHPRFSFGWGGLFFLALSFLMVT